MRHGRDRGSAGATRCWVTLLDSSPAMLEIARHAADEAGVAERATIYQGDVSELVESFTASFDVVVCHNVFEFVQDPGAVLLGCARAMRDGSAILSIVVRSRGWGGTESCPQCG